MKPPYRAAKSIAQDKITTTYKSNYNVVNRLANISQGLFKAVKYNNQLEKEEQVTGFLNETTNLDSNKNISLDSHSNSTTIAENNEDINLHNTAVLDLSAHSDEPNMGDNTNPKDSSNQTHISNDADEHNNTSREIQLSSTDMATLANMVTEKLADKLNLQQVGSNNRSNSKQNRNRLGKINSITMNTPRSRSKSSFNSRGTDFDEDSTFNAEVEMYKVRKGSEKKMLRMRPYMGCMYRLGCITLEKDVSRLEDGFLIRAINKWIAEDLDVSRYKANLLYAISKVPLIWLDNKKGRTTPSLLVRLINAIDVNNYSYKKGSSRKELTFADINNLFIEFKEELSPPSQLVSQNSVTGQKFTPNNSGKYSFRSSKMDIATCHKYNKGDNCNFPACRFAHVCSKHLQLGQKQSHPAASCTLPERQQ